ncbi:MAG: CsbD family protein [Chloroflexi bacterium]|nr:CsbD family protein [Chloroflexota bacterium]
MSDGIKDKVEGKFHEVKGAATGDTAEELKGKAQGLKGDVERQADQVQREDVREEARRNP